MTSQADIQLEKTLLMESLRLCFDQISTLLVEAKSKQVFTLDTKWEDMSYQDRGLKEQYQALCSVQDLV